LVFEKTANRMVVVDDIEFSPVRVGSADPFFDLLAWRLRRGR
jgi:hypothetical protein